MKSSLILLFLWVIASALTAMLPMRRQFIPGVALLIMTPFMLAYLGYQYGLWVALLGFAAFLSIFRNPLKYLVRRALGMPVKLPRELEGNEP